MTTEPQQIAREAADQILVWQDAFYAIERQLAAERQRCQELQNKLSKYE